MKPTSSFDTRGYWERRLAIHPDSRGTGHHRLPLECNEALYGLARERLESALKRHDIDLKDTRILDVGSGFGYFVGCYEEWGASRLVGIDLTHASAKHLSEAYPGYSFVQADASFLPFPLSVQFDLVLALNVFYHIVDEERFLAALSGACRRVRPGGYLVVSDSFRPLRIPAARHVRLRGLSNYGPALEEAGLRPRGFSPLYFLNIFLPFVPLGQYFLSKRKAISLLLRIEDHLRNKHPSGLGILNLMVAERLLGGESQAGAGWQ